MRDKQEEIIKHYKRSRSFYVNTASKRLGGNRAVGEEAVQDAYERAFQHLEKWNGDASFDTWFRTIFNNVVRDTSHKEKLYGAIEGDIEDDTEINTYVHEVSSCIEKYRCIERDQLVLKMRYIDGMSIKDIPNFVPMSYANARKICNLFKKYLEESCHTN